MFDVDACYKIAFDALFEGAGLESVAEKVRDFIHASVFFMDVTGEIYAYASASEGKELKKARKKQLSIRLYDYLQKKKSETDQRLYHLTGRVDMVDTEIEVNGRLFGYSGIVFEEQRDERRDNYAAVAGILSQVASTHWKYHNYNLNEYVPMRKRLCDKAVFDGKESDLEYLSQEMPGSYILIYFPKAAQEKLAQFVRGMWTECCVQADGDGLWTLLYNVSGKKEQVMQNKLRKMDAACCVSAPFEELKQCGRKKKWLRQMDSLQVYDKDGGILYESKWYMQTMYTYARPMLVAAGLSDYSMQILQRGDEKNNTELYETLKTYLLYGNNIAETAAQLHIHRNTLVYRLKKIRELLEIDINDVKISEELLAFMMMNDVL